MIRAVFPKCAHLLLRTVLGVNGIPPGPQISSGTDLTAPKEGKLLTFDWLRKKRRPKGIARPQNHKMVENAKTLKSMRTRTLKVDGPS